MARFHSAVDWLYGFIFNDASLTGGKDTFIQGVSLVTNGSGLALGTAGNPLITAGTGGSSGITQAELIAALKSTGTPGTPVASSTSPATIIASNVNRKGATVANTDANILYLLCGAGTVSATNFTVALGAGNTNPTYWECPFGHTGVISGVWAADGAGSAYTTEFA